MATANRPATDLDGGSRGRVSPPNDLSASDGLVDSTNWGLLNALGPRWISLMAYA